MDEVSGLMFFNLFNVEDSMFKQFLDFVTTIDIPYVVGIGGLVLIIVGILYKLGWFNV